MSDVEIVILLVVAALLAHALALPKAPPGDSGDDAEPPA